MINTFRSFAKVNLYLDVLCKRATDGYHNIKSLFASIDLCDNFLVEVLAEGNASNLVNNTNLICEGEGSKQISTRSNIVYKVIEKLSPYLKQNIDVGQLNITLTKRIPLGAGLGGGSSNAASLMLFLNNYLNLGLSVDNLQSIATSLGADVPFFIQGGLAKAEGIGDKLSFYKDMGYHFFVVIVYPDINISTKEAYNLLRIDTQRDSDADINRIITALEEKDIISLGKYMYNAFEKSQFALHPVLEKVKDGFKKAGALAVTMSGSGSCMLAISFRQSTAKSLYNAMKKTYKTVFIARSIC